MTSSINSVENCSQYLAQEQKISGDSENQVQRRKQKLNLGNKQKNQEYVSTSTLHNIKTIRQYKQHLKNFKKSNKQSQNQCDYTTLLVKQVPDREIFFLIGDIIVEPNFREEWYSIGEPSPYNYYKYLIRNVFYKERGLLQSDYSQSDKGLKDFSNIIHILKNYPDQETHDYGLILEEYQKRCQELQQIGQIMKSNPEFPQFREIQDKKYVDFVKRCEKYIDIERSKKGEFFFYAFSKLDLDKFSYDIQSFGVSNAMSQLLGLELSSLSKIIQKKGLISSFSNCTRQMIMKNFIQALSKKCQSNSGSTQDVSDITVLNLTVHTWDGLSINVEGHFHSVYDRNDDFSLIPFTEIMSMVHVKVDQNVLDAVNKMRSNQQTEKMIMDASGEDFYYNLQFQVFYDKFYASNNNNETLANQEKMSKQLEEIQKKTCRYRNIL